MVAGRVGTAERSGVPLMAFVEIPWARCVTSPNFAVTSATPPFNVWATASNEYVDAYTDAPVPAGEVTLEVRYSKPTAGTEYAFGLGLDAPFEWIYPPSDLDGGGFYEGWRVAWPPVGAVVGSAGEFKLRVKAV